jgi:hypothetical protein
MLQFSRARTVFALCCLVSLPCLTKAQTFTGSIGGQVTDPSGLAVAGVQVTAVETATNETSKTITNGAGEYSLAFLKPGSYRITFQAKNFKEAVRSDLSLQLHQSFRLDQKLEVGAVTETVVVAATVSEVNFDSPEIAHVVGAEQLETFRSWSMRPADARLFS